MSSSRADLPSRRRRPEMRYRLAEGDLGSLNF